MISFKEFLEERTISSKKVELIKDDTLFNLIKEANLAELTKLVVSEKYDLDFNNLLHQIAFERERNKSIRLLYIAEILLQHGADVNRIYIQSTPLMQAVNKNDKDYVKLLLKHKADTTYKNMYGDSACSKARGSEMKSILGCS